MDQICIVSGPGSYDESKKNYYLQPVLHPNLDVNRISHWLSTCVETHSAECNATDPISFFQAFPGLEVLRLVDVDQNCLVETRDMRRYVALSYVWGAASSFRLNKANSEALLMPGSILRDWDQLPVTIQDAIVLDDPRDLDLGVTVMDLIYERSWVTVIAAGGHDANSGLPGVREGSRELSWLTQEIKPRLVMGVHVTLSTLLKHSVYTTRAWTFQEQLLSRRAIYFVGGQVFFRCREDEFSESCVDRPNPRDLDSMVAAPSIQMKLPLRYFTSALTFYTERALSNQDDALRAMAGIIRRFEARMKYRFFEGLPTAALDAFLLFTSFSPNSVLHRRAGFPSYSWTGWRGSIRGPYVAAQLAEWLAVHTWIVWYKRSPSGVVDLVWDPAAEENLSCRDDPDFLGYRERKAFEPREPEFVAGTMIDTSRTSTTERIPWLDNTQRFRYPLLQFWTMAFFFRLGLEHHPDGTRHIFDKNGTACGYMVLDGLEESPAFFNSGELFEVILLSEQGRYHNSVKERAEPCYEVMLLEWIDGVAERRGIGRYFGNMPIEGFAPGPVWKEILLS